MAEVNPFEIEFEDENKPSKKLGIFDKAVNKIKDGIPLNEAEEKAVEEVLENEEVATDWRKEFPDSPMKTKEEAERFKEFLKKENPGMSDEMADRLSKGDVSDIPDSPSLDVPEIETEVVDLPPEDENEKEIIVDNNPKDSTMGDGVEEVNPDDIQLEGDVIDNDGEYYENSVSGEEVGDPSIAPSDEEIADVKDTKKPEESGEDANKKEEPKEEKKEPMSDEDALKEAQELAQDELAGFKISGANWEKMSEKQKAEAIKAFKDANKKEDHRTYNSKDESTTNNFETYERYPTGLKVASMAGNALQTAGEDVGSVARSVGKQGTNSGSIANEVARAVPHFDYRSLFR